MPEVSPSLQHRINVGKTSQGTVLLSLGGWVASVHGVFLTLLTFICTLADERLITPVWDLSRELHLATRDGLQGQAMQLRPLLQKGGVSPALCELAGSLMQSLPIRACYILAFP